MGLVEDIRKENGPLRSEKFQSARQFLESRYPEISGPGWLERENLRAWVVEFLEEWEGAEDGGDDEILV